MKQFALVCFLLMTIAGISQTFPKKYVDSLTVVALSKKSNHPLLLNRDSALQVLWQSNSIAERIKVFYDIVAYSDELTPEQSLYYHELILEGAQKRNDKVLEASVLAELGYITSRNGNTADGLKMLYKSLELAEATGNAQALGIAYNNLGNCYPNNMQLSKNYFTKALENSRKGNDYLFTCFNMGNLAGILTREQKGDSALLLYLECYRLAVDKNLEAAIPNYLLRLSDFDNQENRLHYYHQASQMPFAVRNAGMKRDIDFRRAVYYLGRKQMDSVFFYSNKVNNYARTASLTTQMSALALMGHYYRALPNTDSTLSYLERFYALRDSLYGSNVVEQAQNMAYNEMQRQKELIAEKAAFQTRMIVYFLSAAAIFLLGLAFILWRSKRKEQHAKRLVQQQKDQLEQTLTQLKSTQSQLIQSEKMASLGELTAGIAHEIQNPLNFVNNFAEVSLELIDEMKQESSVVSRQSSVVGHQSSVVGHQSSVMEIIDDIRQNLDKILHHGKRADGIVKGMLQHSRTSTGQKEPTDINTLADEYLRLAYHGLRAKDKDFNATMKTDYDLTIGNINIIPQDMGRVVLNLITNAFYAVHEKKKQLASDLSALSNLTGQNNYEPTVAISTKKSGGHVLISVKDNGNGIPEEIKKKIFQPFFTTKPTGEGTGLGLSMSYDIITKGHGGEISVASKDGEGTEFTVHLPIS